MRHQVGEGALIDRLPRLAMVAPFNEREIDDVFEGKHAAIGFNVAEIALRRIKLSRRGNRTERARFPVFRGLLFAVATPHQLAVPILLRGPAWFFFTPWRNNNPRHAGLAWVAVPDRAFARRFSLWTTDAEAALAVVSADCAALMVSLSRARDGVALRPASTATGSSGCRPARAASLRREGCCRASAGCRATPIASSTRCLSCTG